MLSVMLMTGFTCVTLNMSSCSAFNLDWAKILLSSKELIKTVDQTRELIGYFFQIFFPVLF